MSLTEFIQRFKSLLLKEESEPSSNAPTNYRFMWFDSVAGAVKFKDDTGTVTTISGGSGDVAGPGSAVNNNFVAFDGTTGKLIKDSGSAAATFAAASHTHAAPDITSGTIAAARLGSGTANSSTFLTGAQTYALPPAVQIISAVDNVERTVTGNIPIDNTKPQKTTEVGVYSQLDCTITPKNASNIIEIIVSVNVYYAGISGFGFNLFTDAGADSIACWNWLTPTTGWYGTLTFQYKETAGSTSARTYSFGIGGLGGSAGITVNSGGSSLYNGVFGPSKMTVIERTP